MRFIDFRKCITISHGNQDKEKESGFLEMLSFQRIREYDYNIKNY